MKDGGRIAAAIEVLADIETRHRPVKLALQDWGKAHRFAGSADRAWISGLVLDVLRRRRSLGWRMNDDSRRAVCIAALHFVWSWPTQAIRAACAEKPHGPGALTAAEAMALKAPRDLAAAPEPVRGDYADWLDPHFARVFGDDRAEQLAALAARAPVDLGGNILKAEPTEVLRALEGLGARPFGPLATTLRIEAPAADLRMPPVEAHPAYARGFVEVQDAGSQRVAQMASDVAGRQVLDLCAGGGGKTLALAAAMNNTGRLYAFDADDRRMADLIPRADRAGVTNLDVRTPLDREPLKDLEHRMDLVVVDAPCTGAGTWRRNPDAKWRLKPAQLEKRMAEQDQVLDHAARLAAPKGRILYITCSLLAEENGDRVEAFLARDPTFRRAGEALRLTPLNDGTDGFFAQMLERG